MGTPAALAAVAWPGSDPSSVGQLLVCSRAAVSVRDLGRDVAPQAEGCPVACHRHPSPCPPCPMSPWLRAKLKLDRLKRRGKAPPKKGAGKRAGKKK